MGAAKAMKAMKAKRISKIRRASFRRPWCSGGPRSAQSAAQQGGAPEEQAGQGVVEEAERGGQARIQAHPELDQCRQGGAQGAQGARLRGGQREDPAGQGHLREGKGDPRCPEVRALLKTELAGAVAPFVVLPRGIPRSGLRS